MFKNIDFSKILDYKRIFEAQPGAFFRFYAEFTIFFGFLFLIAAILSIFIPFYKNVAIKKLLKKIKRLCFTISLTGISYLFFRFENTYFFSGRYFLIAILLIFTIWFLYIGFYALRKLPEDLKAREKKMMLKKYIPKPKKKK